MSCGELRLAPETYWTFCKFNWSYPCGIRWCAWRFTYPCGVLLCAHTFRFPCGVRWCHRWGIRYPCGVRWCTGTITYPCGIRYCTGTIPYPCGLRYCRGTGWYPCRKSYETLKYCYDFSTLKEQCVGVVEHITGCCDGMEYSAWDTCLGYTWGNFSGKTVCFYSRLGTSGKCTDMSQPPGSPQGPLDGGTVAPHRAAVTAALAVIVRLFARKLGSCRRCIRQVATLTIAGWLPLLLSDRRSFALPRVALQSVTAVLSLLLVAHMVAFVVKRARLRARDCSCSESISKSSSARNAVI